MKDPARAENARSGCVVILNYHYPPDGSVGGLRWAGFAKYLARSGWEVHVITAAPQNGDSGEPSLHVHSVPRAATLNDLYNSLALRFLRRRAAAPVHSAGNASATASGAADARARGPIGWLRAEVSAWLVFPDQARGWLLRAGRRARSIVRTRRADVVISSGPPHTAHLAARIAVAGTRVPHIVDMRDPWTSFAANAEADVLASSGLRRTLLPRFERYIFARAAHIVTNARELAESHSGRQPDLPISWLPNGIDAERLPAPDSPSYPGLALAYVGTLYFGRDLGPVLDAFALFLERNPAARSDGSALRIAGNIVDEHRTRLDSQLRNSRIEPFVQVLGRIEPAAALELLNRSSLAIVLAQDQKLQVPAKLYESVGMGLPTLVVTELNSASAREAERIGGIGVEADDVEGMCRVFEQLWSGETAARSTPLVAISYSHLTEEMSRLLRRTTGR